MKTVRLGLLAAVIIPAALVLGKTSTPPIQSLLIPGAPVELFFRALQPGEVILVLAKENPSIKRIVLRLQSQIRRIEFSDGSRPLALLGLDVAAKAQSCVLEITSEHSDGSAETFRQDLIVESKEFPKKNFLIAQSMLNPPAAEAERVKREADLIAAVLSVVSPKWLASGSFLSPLPDYEPYPNFGQRRIYNKTTTSTHAGVDIAAPWGTPVKAANAGRVVLAGRFYLSGNTVIIDHGLGVFTYYCHFSKLLVKRGDIVKKGDLIAKVGNTGRSTGPHLHWSLRILNNRVDPFSLVALPLEGGAIPGI
jgi:murein DD-endopeptidase MepM/ murein hydrolase activator NlpD